MLKQFLQGQSCIPELNWAHVAQRRMHPLLVAPPDAWVGLAAELAEVGERPPIDELLLQDPVGGLDGRVVVRVALAGGGPPDIERLQQVVDVGVRELAAAIRAEHVDVRQREPQRGEGGLHQPRVLPAACRVPHDLAVAQVYEQASVVPFAADAHVGEVAHDVGMGRVAVELAVEDVGRLRLARLGGAGFVFLASVGADQAFLIHYPLYPALEATMPSLASARFILGASRSRRLSS